MTISASFVSLDPPTGSKIDGNDNDVFKDILDPPPISGDRFVYGYTSSVINADDVVGNVQSQISFTRSYNRTPVYGIGSPSPTSMLLDGIEEEIDRLDEVDASASETAAERFAERFRDKPRKLKRTLRAAERYREQLTGMIR